MPKGSIRCGGEMIPAIQERLAEIPKVNPSLQDGLVTYDILKATDEKIFELRHQIFATKASRKESEQKVRLLESVEKKTLSFKELSDRYTTVKKWIEAGYDRTFITSDPEAVTFFGIGDFRTLLLFKNSTSQLKRADMDLHFDKDLKKVLFKVQGQWKLLSEIKDLITIDTVEKQFRGWTYVHPDGFVPIGRTEWTTLRPYARLSRRAHEELKEEASAFWSESQPEIDPGVDKPCVLQVFVAKNDKDPAPSLLKNFRKMFIAHCYVRLIDSLGWVYCCGAFRGTLKDIEHCCPGGFTLKTTTYRAALTDGEERHSYEADSVAIPLSVKRFLQIKERNESFNQNGGIRVCITRRNCCRNAQEILELAGVKVDTRLTLGEWLVGSLPDVADVPCVGRPLDALSRVVTSAYRLSPSFVPSPIKKLTSWVWNAAWFLPQKVLTTMSSLCVIALGGTKGTPVLNQKQGTPVDDFNMKRLIDKPSDIFKPIVIYSSGTLRSWILRQRNHQLLGQSHGLFVGQGSHRKE
jgi:hypothetical protein